MYIHIVSLIYNVILISMFTSDKKSNKFLEDNYYPKEKVCYFSFFIENKFFKVGKY